MASAAYGRGTWFCLASLIGNELVEIGVGEHLAGALRAVADDDVFQITRVNMTVEGLDRAAEFCSCLGSRAQPIRRAQCVLTANVGPFAARD